MKNSIEVMKFSTKTDSSVGFKNTPNRIAHPFLQKTIKKYSKNQKKEIHFWRLQTWNQTKQERRPVRLRTRTHEMRYHISERCILLISKPACSKIEKANFFEKKRIIIHEILKSFQKRITNSNQITYTPWSTVKKEKCSGMPDRAQNISQNEILSGFSIISKIIQFQVRNFKLFDK